jgi:hypothetical protein
MVNGVLGSAVEGLGGTVRENKGDVGQARRDETEYGQASVIAGG